MPEPTPSRRRFGALLRGIYGEATGRETEVRLCQLLDSNQHHPAPSLKRFSSLSQNDVLLITYADQVLEDRVPPLQSLTAFCSRRLEGLVSGVHILPFYPWTSDDGFSVKDYFAVEPEYGSWNDIGRLGDNFDLMFDAVFNHMSAQGEWFQRFSSDDPEFRDFFVTIQGSPDLSAVVRPRALPLLTRFETARGPENVWTTFSADQVDLNVRNPRVLMALMEVLLFYAGKGARFIRLDAIAYLWKEPGTSCIHLPQTHKIIQLMRALLDACYPDVRLITETNVPHADNMSYLGNGSDEAQLVYNFALPPLVLHALLRGDATHLSRWASGLVVPSEQTTFFNFLASHDGIGLNPARGILPGPEINFLVERCVRHGGFINYKRNVDGSESPYEMNIVYFDALNDPASADTVGLQVSRFMVAQAIMLCLAGVPGIYFHSLVGSRNDREAAMTSGINRRINRSKLQRHQLEAELHDPTCLRRLVFERYRQLLLIRRSHPAFDPASRQRVLEGEESLFAVWRAPRNGQDGVLCLHNMTDSPVTLRVTVSVTGKPPRLRMLLDDCEMDVSETGVFRLSLSPYEIKWIEIHGACPGSVHRDADPQRKD